jgi:hypothetical protein
MFVTLTKVICVLSDNVSVALPFEIDTEDEL